jgi:hypothetical protein
MTTDNSMQPFTVSPLAFPREQSDSALMTATRSPNDPGKTLERTTAVLALYFDPEHDPKIKAAQREEFVRALSYYPDWAVQRAFDAWVRTGNRRPTPGDIVILAGRETKPIHDEIARRKREAEEVRNSRPEMTPEEKERRRNFVASLMDRVGLANDMNRPTGPRREEVTEEDREEAARILAKYRSPETPAAKEANE